MKMLKRILKLKWIWGRDVPDNPFLNDVDIEEYEDWVLGHIGEPEYLGER